MPRLDMTPEPKKKDRNEMKAAKKELRKRSNRDKDVYALVMLKMWESGIHPFIDSTTLNI